MLLRKFKLSFLIIVFLGLLISLLVLLYISKPDGRLHLKVFDVGQGDSIFIKTASGYKILVDGGPDNTVLSQLAKEMWPWERKIDFVILTHPQSDHLFGLIEVVKRYQIGTLLYSEVTNKTSDFQEWERLLLQYKVRKQIAFSGEEIDFPDQTKIKFVWPKEEHPQITDLNQAAVAFTLNFGNFSSLLTGDADAQNQPYTSSTVHTDVLKVPHHGSKTSLEPTFLQKLSPTVSIISVGAKNRYGHPNPELLNLLKAANTKIFRTDENGSIEVVSDGKSWYTKADRGN